MIFYNRVTHLTLLSPPPLGFGIPAHVRRLARPPALPCPAREVLVLDNYDSFTYNLVQYLGELGAELEVVRNDDATVDELLDPRL